MIDYAKANRQFRTQKAALTRAVNSGNSEKVIAATKRAVGEWEEVGSWPDSWSNWQRALDDAYNADRAAYVSGKTDVRPVADRFDIDYIRRQVHGLV